MNRRAVIRTFATAGVAGLAGCTAVLGDGDYDIGMTADSFVPSELTVEPGTTVVWENTSARGHTVTAYENDIPADAEYFASGGFEDETTARERWWNNHGGLLENGDTFSHTFEIPGEYGYVCIPHEVAGMIGRIYVEE